MLLRVRLDSHKSAYVYCLVEHKRTSEAAVMFQLLRYLSAVYERLGTQFRVGAVPTVIPIVVYNGVSAWPGPHRFADVLARAPGTSGLRLDLA